MLLSDAVLKRLNYLMKQKNMNEWKLYKSSGVPKSTISAIMNSTHKLPKMDTLLHICEGLDITIREFYNDPMFDDVEQD